MAILLFLPYLALFGAAVPILILIAVFDKTPV